MDCAVANTLEGSLQGPATAGPVIPNELLLMDADPTVGMGHRAAILELNSK
jgi:hypothetical protein